MPLIKSLNKKAISKNIETEMHAGKPQKQAIAIAYNVKKADGGIVDNSKMIDSLMAKRKKKLEADQDFNTSPDLRESSASLSNDTHFDSLNADETPMSDREEVMYSEGGIAYNPNLKENYQDDTTEEHNETSYSEPAGDYGVDRNPQREAYYADGGPIPAPVLPGAQSAQESMQKAFGKAKGGEIDRKGEIPPVNSFDSLHDKDGNDKPHHDSLPQGSGEEDAFYKPKQIGNQGRPTIDLNMYAPGGRVKMAYGQGRTEIDQEDTPEQKADEMSTHTMAEGGTVDSERHLDPDYQDRKQSHDEDSGIAMAGGGSVTHAVTLEPDDTDRPQQHNEDDASHNTEPASNDYGADTDPEREAYYAEGGDVDRERHLHADDTDTAESKDEHSEIAMHDGGGIPYDASMKSKPKSSISIHDPLDHSDNQTPPANPKSHETEKKSKRRKMMIASLNE